MYLAFIETLLMNYISEFSTKDKRQKTILSIDRLAISMVGS